jgi:hypothetical protein
VYALGCNKTYNEVNLRESSSCENIHEKGGGKKKKKAYKDLARFLRACDEFS